jgi:hypothetical protein
MSKTRATIGMQKYPLTCAVEVAGLNDVESLSNISDQVMEHGLKAIEDIKK